jgi:PIN domain nuclease of toxin-antitoxin system
MATKHIVDAHAIIWYLECNPKLGGAAKTILDDPNSELVLPAIALAEVCAAVASGRTALKSAIEALATIVADNRIVVLPLDQRIIERSLSLPAIPEMHDSQIVASALWLAEQGETVVLLTRDAVILKSGLVPIIW